MIHSHHEHWDGGGYPDGLHREDIPLTARMLCVADVYDALTSSRSYRDALSRDDALDVMALDSGTILDPALFTVFRAIIK
jgi:HD-GYP domain-containing protein (c-di-GMP phosphodiesterase class II)